MSDPLLPESDCCAFAATTTAAARTTTFDVDLFEEDDINQVLGCLHNDDSTFNDLDLFTSFIQEPPLQDRIVVSSEVSFHPPQDLFQLDMSQQQAYLSSQQQQQQQPVAAAAQVPFPSADLVHSSQGPSGGQIQEAVDELPEKPKRSLTAYNLFFKDERARLLKILPVKGKTSRKSHGKIGFAEMARTVAVNWKKISREEKMAYEYRSELDKKRFEVEYAAWKKALHKTAMV